MSLTAEQLEARLGYVTGSDASTIMGLNPWGNVVELWKQKRRMTQAVDISGNAAIRAGNYLEPVVRQWFQDDTGKVVTTDSTLLIHPTIPYVAANIDGRVVSDKAVFEAKTSSTDRGWGAVGENIIPDYYLCQVAHYMAVEDAERAYVAVLIRGSDFRWYTINRDHRLEDLILKNEAEFWSLVQTNVAPTPRTSEEVISLHGYQTCDESIQATLQIEQDIFKLKEIKEHVKSSQASQKKLEERVKVYMGTSPTLMSRKGTILSTWRTAKTSTRFNAALFKEEQKELHDKYLTKASEQRRFLIK